MGTSRFGDSELVSGDGVAVASLRADVDGRLQTLMTMGNQLALSTGTTVALLILRADTPPPDPALRRRAKSVLGALLKHARVVAVVVEGAGIAATTKRTMVRIVATVVRARAEFRVFSDVGQARTWLVRPSDEAPIGEALDAALAKLANGEVEPLTG